MLVSVEGRTQVEEAGGYSLNMRSRRVEVEAEAGSSEVIFVVAGNLFLEVEVEEEGERCHPDRGPSGEGNLERRVALSLA